MPLVGIRCEVDNRCLSFDECIACAEDLGACQFTPEMIREMKENTESRGNAGISITTLLGCQRKGYFSLAEDYYQKPSQLWAATRGTVIHRMFERHVSPGVICKTRFAREFDGVVVTGEPDKLVPARRLLVDYKTKDKFPDQMPEDHVWQLNGYAAILQDGYELKTGSPVHYEVSALGIVVVTMSGVKKYPVELKPLGVTLQYFQRRAEALAEALRGDSLPPRMTDNQGSSRFCSLWCPHLEDCLES